MPEVTSADGTMIGYDLVGSGPAVILVSGAAQYRAIDQHTPALVRILAEHFTVITYDRRGRGQSGDTRPYAVAREVEDIAALLTLAGGKAFLFGQSSGAILALEAAAAMPRQVSALALYDQPIDPARSSDAYRYQHMQMVMLAAQHLRAVMMSDFLLSVGISSEALDAFKTSPEWPAYADIGHTIAHDYRILSEARATDATPLHWQNAIMPVLVMNGDKSLPFMSAGADWVASGLHNAERITLADQGQPFDPNLLAPVLVAFFGFGSVQVH